MQSHPDYPALVSFTDTLDEVGIKYRAFKVDSDQYVNLEYPLLAHGKFNIQEDFLIINSEIQFEANNNLLLNQWDGIALIVIPTEVNCQEEILVRRKARNKNLQLWIGIAGIYLIMIGASCYHFELTEFLLVFMSLLGIFICSLIILKSMGIENSVTEKLCSAEDDSGCDKVIQSPVATLFNNFGLGDTGWIYFLTISLFLILSSLNSNIVKAYNFLMIPFTTSILLSFLSFWYQWKIVKNWCRLCLIIAAIVWVQLSFLLFTKQFQFVIDFSQNAILLFSVSVLFSLSLWLIIKPLIINIQKSIIDEILLFKWKRDPKIFIPFLKSQKKINIQTWVEDITTGSLVKPISITICAGPYCVPCAKTHEILDDLINRYPNDINLTIRFAIQTTSLLDRRTKAVLHLLEAAKKQAKGNSLHLISDWYHLNNLDKFSCKYGTNPSLPEFQHLLTKHIEWSNDCGIQHTPTIFINGYELPNQYSTKDIIIMMPQLLEMSSLI
jgi:uncharacterized membrane protein